MRSSDKSDSLFIRFIGFFFVFNVIFIILWIITPKLKSNDFIILSFTSSFFLSLVSILGTHILNKTNK